MKKNIFITVILLYSISGNCQSWQWAKQIGGLSSTDDQVKSMISDGVNIYVIGMYGGNLYFDDTLNSNGTDDIFIIKYDASGNLLWSKTLGGGYTGVSAHEYANGVYDPVNNCIYITGTFINSISLPGYGSLASGTGDEDIFLAKMDLNGNFSWGKKISSMGDDYAYIFAKPDGNILLEGHLANNGMADTISLVDGGFFASYDNNGNLLWAKHVMDGPDVYQVSVVFIDNDFVLTGTAGPASPAIIDTANINVEGTYDGFLARFDSTANLKWIKRFDGSGNGGLNWISKDSDNNIYGVGSIIDTVNIDDTTLIHPNYDYMIAKFNENGSLKWVKTGNSTVGAAAATVFTFDTQSLYVCGAFIGNSDFGSINLNAASSQDMFISRFDSSGNCNGVYNFGQASATQVYVNTLGNVFVGGTFLNTVTIGANTFTSHGGNDIFVSKLDGINSIPAIRKNENNELLIYANPNKGTCNINVPDNLLTEQNLELKIYNIEGKLIQETPVMINQVKVSINLQAEAKGIYNVTLGNKKKTYTGKVVFE